jgi:hypothetical protein
MLSPPVPSHIRLLLTHYPELIRELEQELSSVVTRPLASTPPFEVAVWVLESTLASFIQRARAMLADKQPSGNIEAIHAAQQLVLLLHRVHSRNGGLYDLDELWAHFNGGQP